MSDSGSGIKCSNVEGYDGASSDAGGYGVGGSDGECVDIGGYDADGSEAEGSNTESSTSNLQTFELFPRLPIEIRYMIWHVTFPGPQRHVWCDLDGACCKLLGIFVILSPCTSAGRVGQKPSGATGSSRKVSRDVATTNAEHHLFSSIRNQTLSA